MRFCFCHYRKCDKKYNRRINKERELNKSLINLFQIEKNKNDILIKIIYQIKQELSLMEVKDYPKKEKANIPKRILGWLNEFDKIYKEDENGVHK